jgi:hypothetical protein
MEMIDMDAGCPFMLVNPWVKTDVRVMDMYPWMEIKDVIVVCP